MHGCCCSSSAALCPMSSRALLLPAERAAQLPTSPSAGAASLQPGAPPTTTFAKTTTLSPTVLTLNFTLMQRAERPGEGGATGGAAAHGAHQLRLHLPRPARQECDAAGGVRRAECVARSAKLTALLGLGTGCRVQGVACAPSSCFKGPGLTWLPPGLPPSALAGGRGALNAAR